MGRCPSPRLRSPAGWPPQFSGVCCGGIGVPLFPPWCNDQARGRRHVPGVQNSRGLDGHWYKMVCSSQLDVLCHFSPFHLVSYSACFSGGQLQVWRGKGVRAGSVPDKDCPPFHGITAHSTAAAECMSHFQATIREQFKLSAVGALNQPCWTPLYVDFSILCTKSITNITNQSQQFVWMFVGSIHDLMTLFDTDFTQLNMTVTCEVNSTLYTNVAFALDAAG